MTNIIQISSAEKSAYIRSITVNSIFILICLGVIGLFIVPNYESISEKVDSINNLVAKEAKYKTSGVTFDEYNNLITKYQDKSSIAAKTDEASVSQALAMDADSKTDYVSWVEEQVSSGSLSRYTDIEERNNAIIGNIIPTLGDDSLSELTGMEKNIVTLPTLTQYIEERILKGFSLDSLSTVGIDAIKYEDTKNPNINIGSFVVSLDVSGRNKKILDLIDFVQNSGKLSIEKGTLVATDVASQGGVYSSLSNLLIALDEIKTKEALMSNDATNTATLKLRFFIKGRTYASYLQIKSVVTSKFSTVKSSVDAVVAKNSSISASNATDAMIDAVSDAKNLASLLSDISKKLEDIQKNTKTTDFDGNFDALVSIYASLETIEARIARDTAVFKK